MMRRSYSAITLLLTPLIRKWLWRRAAWGKEDPTRMGERFGDASQPRPPGRLIWVHAASVGEVQSVLALARQLAAQPSVQLLITTGTVTSAQLVAQQDLPHTIHQFIPVDTYRAVRRFLQHWQPDLVLWVESEFWPQLLWQVQSRRIPALLINARMSEKSMRGWQHFPFLARSMLATFQGIYAGSSEDASRLRKLGAGDIYEAGNLKFDAAPLSCDEAALAALQSAIGNRPVWVAASTHAGEETALLETHQALARIIPELLTIIVPRHAARGNEISAMIAAQGLSFVQRSKSQPLTPQIAIYLADTMGELGLFYRAAPIAFIGGSLVAHGGHNPLEPALLGCAIVTGTHTYNFAAITEEMQAAGALWVVADAANLATQLARLFTDGALRDSLVHHAKKFMQSRQGATSTILQHIARLLS